MKSKIIIRLENHLPALLMAALACPWPAEAATLLVYNNNDAGAGSLRQALQDNAALGAGNTIIFSNTVTGTITLGSRPGVHGRRGARDARQRAEYLRRRDHSWPERESADHQRQQQHSRVRHHERHQFHLRPHDCQRLHVAGKWAGHSERGRVFNHSELRVQQQLLSRRRRRWIV